MFKRYQNLLSQKMVSFGYCFSFRFYGKIRGMKIKKLGHCCLVVEIEGKKIMIDPGSYTIKEQSIEYLSWFCLKLI